MEEKEVLSKEEKEKLPQEEKVVKEIIKEKIKYNKGPFIILLIIIIILIALLMPSKKKSIKVSVRSTLETLVEKSDLETVNITYNVIAKKCKDDNSECDKKSNDISDFKYVVSCKGTITAGIDFENVKIDVDTKNKKLIVTMPEATIKGEPNIGSIKFLNGGDVPADELPNARVLCQETTKQKSEEDNKLIPAAKEQARIVLEEFYKQWIKAYDSSYQVEIK